MSETHDRPPPVVCTLDPSQRSARQLQWSDVAGLARSSERLPDGVACLFDPELAEQLHDLASRELDCCGSWLQIVITTTEHDLIRLQLTTTNPEGLAMITAMAGRSQ